MHSRKFSIKHIATQAAVSPATVDRVINNRPGVRTYTKQRVQNAINELEEYEAKINFSRKQLYVDVVMNTEGNNNNTAQKAFLSALRPMKMYNINLRFHFFKNARSAFLAREIDRIVESGTHGLVIRANNDPSLKESIEYAFNKDIPTITLGTDIPHSKRVDYIGANNFSEGQTAAYLIGQWLKNSQQTVLLSISKLNFFNQIEREMGFRQYIRRNSPNIQIAVLPQQLDAGDETFHAVNNYLENGGDARAVYSLGGSGTADILAAYEASNKPINLFIAHDLNKTNKSLMADNKIHTVLDRNINIDANNALFSILKFYKYVRNEDFYMQNHTSVITPCNLAMD